MIKDKEVYEFQKWFSFSFPDLVPDEETKRLMFKSWLARSKLAKSYEEHDSKDIWYAISDLYNNIKDLRGVNK